MSHLFHHLEQVSSSAKAIGELQFAPPGIFTNALLGDHEITNLIRDTEPHERALFSVDLNDKSLAAQRRSNRRTATFSAEENRSRASFKPVARKQSAVARVLGSDMLQEIETYRGQSTRRKQKGPGRVNIEVLLNGAEKLCAIYPVEGAPEKIASLRKRYAQVADSVALYEELVASQTAKLDHMNKNADHNREYEDSDDMAAPAEAPDEAPQVTQVELRSEEQEIRELEQKKQALDERIASMDKDLGGLLR